MRLFPSLAIATSLAACAQVPPPQDARVLAPGELPTGATLSASGYLDIGQVPERPYPETAPPMPTQIDSFARQTAMGTEEEREAAWERANGSEEFQRRFNALRQEIALGERDNFITVRLVRDPAMRGEFIFRRDGAATLAKYTSDPVFFASEAPGADPSRDPQAELSAWFDRLRPFGMGTIGSVDPLTDVIEIETGVTEARFMGVARAQGWEWGNEIKFGFAAEQEPPFLDARIGDMVRVFPRATISPGIILTSLTTGRILLHDGCFRLGGPDGPLAVFERDAQLAFDEQGYLVIASPQGARIGEAAGWGGYPGGNEDEPDIRRLRQQCGDAELVAVGDPASMALFGLPDPLWVYDYAMTKQIGYQAAWTEVIGCMKRQSARGRGGLEARDRCIDQYNGWDYRGEDLPPPPPG